MALNLENSSGLTANFGPTGFANSAAANTNISTTTATNVAINGVVLAVGIKAAAAAPVNDFATGRAFVTLLGGQASVFVTGVDTSGNLQTVQGPVVAYNLVNPIAGQATLPFPALPNGFCPVAYQVVKNKNPVGTAAWTYAVSLFNASNLSFEPPVHVTQLPNFGIVNATA